MSAITSIDSDNQKKRSSSEKSDVEPGGMKMSNRYLTARNTDRNSVDTISIAPVTVSTWRRSACGEIRS